LAWTLTAPLEPRTQTVVLVVVVMSPVQFLNEPPWSFVAAATRRTDWVASTPPTVPPAVLFTVVGPVVGEPVQLVLLNTDSVTVVVAPLGVTSNFTLLSVKL
jgi:hypothetical protein